MNPSSSFEPEPATSRTVASGPAPEAVATDPAAAVGPTYPDPVWLIECAWSRLRLSALQKLVGKVSADLSSVLRASERPPAADLEAGGRDPAVEALAACRAELKEACAMRGADAELERYSGVIRDYARTRPSAWRTAFEAGFDQYRRAASQALSRALASPTVA
jgi:hypothetical protein